MRKLSALLLLATSLAALPAHAANRTEVISLKFVPAGELDQFLADNPVEKPLGTARNGLFEPGLGGLGGGVRGKDRPSMIPPGIVAWAVNSQKNTLSLTGSDDAIASVKQIIRLLDIPSRQIRMSVRLVQMDQAEAETLRARPDATKNEVSTLLPLLRSEDREPLERRTALLATSLEISNNRAVHLRAPADPKVPNRTATLWARVNGDGSVTVIAAGLVERKEDGEEPRLLFRISPGQAELILDNERRAWLITPELLPDPSR